MKCLICLEEPISPQGQGEVGDGGVKLLDKQLKAIFLLRQLLRLPPERVTEFLERSAGDHPHEWIRLCESCQVLVEEAFSLYEEQVRIHRKWKKVQQKVVQKVRESEGGGGEEIAEETRHFVKNHNYGASESPSPAAEWGLETQKGIVPEDKVVVKEEVRVGSPDDGHHFDDDPISFEENEEELCALPTRTVQNRKDPSSTPKRSIRIPLKCDLCPEYFLKPQQLRNHRATEHGQGVLPPDSCTPAKPPKIRPTRKPAPSKKPAPKYKRKNTGRPKQKLEPGELFTSEPNGQVMYRCGKCGKEYQRRDSFFHHKLLYRDKPDCSSGVPDSWLTCDLCQEPFFGWQGLQNHKARTHPQLVARPFPCPECPLTFTNRVSRFRHVRHVHRQVPEKRVTWKQPKMRRQCPHCPYTTRANQCLEAHVKRVHESGRKSLHCELCGKGVSREKTLKMHQVLKHSICGVRGCAAQLENKEQLHGHQVTAHGKEVDVFRCSQCAEYLVGQKAMKTHVQLRHPPGEGGGGEQHICEVCGKSFPIADYLRYHVKYTHEKVARKKRKGSSL